MNKKPNLLPVLLILLASCGVGQKISRDARREVLDTKELNAAHVGITIFDPAANKYLYDHQGEKYFVPASNTKIPTCYAAMKYLGDSLVGLRWMEHDTAVFVYPSGDPTLLHPDFRVHPVYDLLKRTRKNIYVMDIGWDDARWGSGWSWNDYGQAYMTEKSPMPLYGNLVKWVQEREDASQPATITSIPEVNWQVNFNTGSSQDFSVEREVSENIYTITEGKEKKREIAVPFVTHGVKTTVDLLQDTVAASIAMYSPGGPLPERRKLLPVHSQPTDSILAIMMHRSDNFFAEQSLLMVSERLTSLLNSSRARDSILNNEFRGLPQKPRWADGSGLSRYNLFTPQDFVVILDKMRKEFGMERLKVIFPTGGEGTISNYYKADSGYIFAKTGTLSGVVAFSGFLYTKKGKLLIFSTLVNNHQSSATEIRKAMERFLQKLRNDL